MKFRHNSKICKVTEVDVQQNQYNPLCSGTIDICKAIREVTKQSCKLELLNICKVGEGCDMQQNLYSLHSCRMRILCVCKVIQICDETEFQIRVIEYIQKL
jgi:hypothetical protein